MPEFGTWLPWAVFAAVIAGMLAIDLGLVHRKVHVVRLREAVVWSVVWVAVSLAFAGLVAYAQGPEPATAFLTAYLVEKALSVDNLFVFMVLFAYFKVPKALEHTVLFWGVVGAIAMRAVLIAAGLSLLAIFHGLIYVFGAVLVATGLRLALRRGHDVDPAHNPVVRLVRRVVPMSPHYDGKRLFTNVDGRHVATPLLLVLVAIETTDLFFAIDSIPAVLAITQDPFLVYTSNIFAILGLRAMYFALAGAIERLRFFNLGLAAVLVFVGVKMLLSDLYPVPVPFSLAVIAGLLAVAVAASLVPPRPEHRRRRPPRLRATPLTREGPDLAARPPEDAPKGS